MATVEHSSSTRCKRHVVSRCVQIAPCSNTKKSLIAILGFSHLHIVSYTAFFDFVSCLSSWTLQVNFCLSSLVSLLSENSRPLHIEEIFNIKIFNGSTKKEMSSLCPPSPRCVRRFQSHFVAVEW